MPSASQERTPRRRRASHSYEAVVGEAVALLDEAGEGALTFRSLAARLGGGVGSIYWYVDSKDALLDAATDMVLARHLEDTAGLGSEKDPLAAMHSLAVALFDTIREHPWTGAYMMRTAADQPHVLEVYERLGQPSLQLGLTPRDTFFAVSAVFGFVVGTAIDLGQQPPAEVMDGQGRDVHLERYAQHWRDLDPERFPFVRQVADEMATHDDAEQFRAGLDLILEGIHLQSGRARRRRQSR
ncbi:TetR/AcrR family transcriptional regulator [Brachybacterium sp. AOP25-B2-12]|uniref:TetR/AcrR family transcriptional regulator n=1 Tax=Brachybacterium sp. AOP25-B2-12 TaxID=3457710 RepID=UPI0040346D0B